MKLNIKLQERYSRGELLLRTFFGPLYILLPHSFILMFISLWSSILTFISFWAILFTGRYPKSFFDFQVKMYRWNARVNASLFNLVDGYPPFGLDAQWEGVELDIPYPEKLSRGLLIVKVLFGFIYVILPHILILYFVMIGVVVINFLSFWAVLFTGKFPASWHRFLTGFLRWSMRINLYMGFMTDQYPPFNGRPDEVEAPSAEGAE